MDKHQFISTAFHLHEYLDVIAHFNVCMCKHHNVHNNKKRKQ